MGRKKIKSGDLPESEGSQLDLFATPKSETEQPIELCEGRPAADDDSAATFNVPDLASPAAVETARPPTTPTALKRPQRSRGSRKVGAEPPESSAIDLAAMSDNQLAALDAELTMRLFRIREIRQRREAAKGSRVVRGEESRRLALEVKTFVASFEREQGSRRGAVKAAIAKFRKTRSTIYRLLEAVP